MPTRFCVIFALLVPAFCFAQHHRIDSLKELFSEETFSASEQGLLAFKIAEQYRNTQFLDSALYYADIGLEFSQLGKEDRRMMYYNITGQVHFLSGSYLLANRFFNAGMDLALETNDKKYQSFFSNSAGISYASSGKYEEALESFYTSLEYARESGKPKRIIPIEMNIVNLQRELGRFETALEKLDDIYQKSMSLGYNRHAVKALMIRSEVLQEKGQYEDALTSLNIAKEMATEHDYLEGISCIENMGRIYSKLGKEKLADELLTNALTSAKDAQQKPLITSIYMSLGDAKFQFQKFDIAANYYEDALQRTDIIESTARIQLFEKLASTYEKLKRMDEAYKNLKEAKSISEEIYAKESALRIAELEANFRFDETMRKIAKLEASEKYNEAKSWALTLLLLFTLVVLGFAIRFAQMKRRSNNILQVKNNQVNIQKKEIENKNKELLNANYKLKELTYMASHDLRDPLMTVRGFIYGAIREHGKEIPEPALYMLERALRGSDRMNDLVKTLLMYESIGKLPDSDGEIDMNDLVEEIIHLMEFRIKDTGAKIEIDGDLPTLSGYRNEVFQLFQNLISNALKFHADNVTPEVFISAKEEKSSWVIFVKDNGIGMDPKLFEKATEMFMRLNNYNTYPGSGIGLAICQKVITHHKWEMGVESKGKGSWFWVRVPKKQEA